MVTMKVLFVVLAVGALCAGIGQAGQIVRPKDAEQEVHAQLICSQEQWDAVKTIKGFNNWTMDTLPVAAGYTVMLTQYRTTVNHRCFGTTIQRSDGKITFTNVYPTQPATIHTFDIGGEEKSAREIEKEPMTSTPPPPTQDSTHRLMIAGASPNFVAYTTCNGNSSYLNVLVTYTEFITEPEKKAINSWIKSSNFTMLGNWAAINFESCSLTKTYVCNGGRDTFCSTIRSRSSKKSRKDSSSSEEDGDEELIIFPW